MRCSRLLKCTLREVRDIDMYDGIDGTKARLFHTREVGGEEENGKRYR